MTEAPDNPINTSEPALAIEDLTVSYAKRPVLWDVDYTTPRPERNGQSLERAKGSLIALVGPNGAGKSTLFKACLGLIPAITGRVRFFGQPLANVRTRVGYVPQRESVDWNFPVNALDVVVMGRYPKLAWYQRVPQEQRAHALACMEQLGIADLARRQIGQLSGGQQQRVFVARALAQEADIYFMDEPFAGVDATTESTIVKVMRDLASKGVTILTVHHDLQTVEQYFDHVMLLNTKLIAHGPVKGPNSVWNERVLGKTYGGRPTLLDETSAQLGNRT
jgi:manganese/zinc/iron transport system ATP- binding protein